MNRQECRQLWHHWFCIRKVAILLGRPINACELSKTKIYIYSWNVEYWIHKIRKTTYRLFVNANCIVSYMFSSQIVSPSKSAVNFIPSICFAVKRLVSHKQTDFHAKMKWLALTKLAWDASDLAVQQVAGRRVSIRWRRGGGWDCWRQSNLCFSSYRKIQQLTPWSRVLLCITVSHAMYKKFWTTVDFVFSQESRTDFILFVCLF